MKIEKKTVGEAIIERCHSHNACELAVCMSCERFQRGSVCVPLTIHVAICGVEQTPEKE